LIAIRGEDAVAVHGYSYPRQKVTESILRYYTLRTEDDGRFRIGLLHGNVGGVAEHHNYAPCTVGELEAVGLDYWALGHVHSHRVLRPAGPPVIYPGSPQGRSPRETGRHGCCIVSVTDGIPEVEFAATDSLRWHRIEIPIAGVDDAQSLLDRLSACLDRVRGEDGTSAVVRFHLTGRGELHNALRCDDALGELVGALRDQERGEPFAWVDRVEVATRPPIDLTARREAQDALGYFLRMADELRQDPVRRGALQQALADVYGRRELREVLEAVSDTTLLALLDEAEVRGVDLLAGSA
jgi:DNA repair exonuclease SbcCD nuclease subunit